MSRDIEISTEQLWIEYTSIVNNLHDLDKRESLERLVVLSNQLIENYRHLGYIKNRIQEFKLQRTFKEALKIDLEQPQVRDLNELTRLEQRMNNVPIEEKLQEVKNKLFLQLRLRLIGSEIYKYQHELKHLLNPMELNLLNPMQRAIQSVTSKQQGQAPARPRPHPRESVHTSVINEIKADLAHVFQDPPPPNYEEKYPVDLGTIPIRQATSAPISAMRRTINAVEQRRTVVINLPGQATSLVVHPVNGDPQAVANRLGYEGVLPKMKRGTMQMIQLAGNTFLYLIKTANRETPNTIKACIIISIVGTMAWDYIIPDVLARRNRFGTLLVANGIVATAISKRHREQQTMIVITLGTVALGYGTKVATDHPYLTALILVLSAGIALSVFRPNSGSNHSTEVNHYYGGNNPPPPPSPRPGPHPASLPLPVIADGELHISEEESLESELLHEESVIEDALEYVHQTDLVETGIDELASAISYIELSNQPGESDDDFELHIGEEEELDMEQKYSDTNALIQVLNTPGEHPIIIESKEQDIGPIYIVAFDWGSEYTVQHNSSEDTDEKKVTQPMQTFATLSATVMDGLSSEQENELNNDLNEMVNAIDEAYNNPTSVIWTAIRDVSDIAVTNYINTAIDTSAIVLTGYVVNYITNRGFSRIFRNPVIPSAANELSRVAVPAIISTPIQTTFKLDMDLAGGKNHKKKGKRQAYTGRKQIKQSNQSTEQQDTTIMFCKMISLSLRHSTPLNNKLDILALQLSINQLFDS